jgi:hypothetical protein
MESSPRKATTAKKAKKTDQPSSDSDPSKPNSTGKREQQDYLATLMAIQQNQQLSDDKRYSPPLINIEAALNMRAL